MKRTRRLAPAFLILALLFTSGLSGCKNNPYDLSPSDPVSLTIWHYYNGTQKIMFDEMVTLFNETVGAKMGIAVESYSHGSVDELSTKVTDAAERNVGAVGVPDIFAAYADTAYEVSRLGLLANIGDYLTAEEIATYVPAYMSEGAFDAGKLMIMPVAKSTEVLLVNATDYRAFADATGVSDEAFATWEGLADVARQYYEWTDAKTSAPEDGRAFFGRDAMANQLIIGCLQLGTELFQVENGVVTLGLDAAVLRRIWDTYYVPYINGYYTSIGRFRSDDAKTGDIIALVGSTSGASYFPHDVTLADGSTYPIEASAYPLPIFEGTKLYAVQQGAGMVVTKSTPKREYAATVFLKWFTAPEQNLRFCIGSGYLPVQIKANRREAIQSEIARLSTPITPILEATLDVGVDTVANYQLYTNQAFKDGTAARAVVNNALQQRAVEDRDAVLALIANGTSRQDAVALYDTDENFDAWFADFSTELAASVEDLSKGA